MVWRFLWSPPSRTHVLLRLYPNSTNPREKFIWASGQRSTIIQYTHWRMLQRTSHILLGRKSIGFTKVVKCTLWSDQWTVSKKLYLCANYILAGRYIWWSVDIHLWSLGWHICSPTVDSCWRRWMYFDIVVISDCTRSAMGFSGLQFERQYNYALHVHHLLSLSCSKVRRRA